MQRETPLKDKPGMKIQWKGVLYYIITCSNQPTTYMVIYDIKVSPKIKLVQLHYEQNTILALDCDTWSGCFSDFPAICMAPINNLKLLNRFWKIKWFWTIKMVKPGTISDLTDFMRSAPASLFLQTITVCLVLQESRAFH